MTVASPKFIVQLANEAFRSLENLPRATVLRQVHGNKLDMFGLHRLCAEYLC